MRLGIMQPYFFPYVGYFQLISSADLFILYDNIKYTKKGWINRNRMLLNGKDVPISLPLKKDSDSLDVCERELSADLDRDKLLNRIVGARYAVGGPCTGNRDGPVAAMVDRRESADWTILAICTRIRIRSAQSRACIAPRGGGLSRARHRSLS